MKKYILLAAAALSLAACNNDDNIVDEPIAARISASIGESALSRAADDKWNIGDEIGITMGDRYVNMKHVTESGDGQFSGSTMYFKNKLEPVDLIAYYPYKGSEGTPAAVFEMSTGAQVQNPDEQTKFDYLFSKLENVTGATPDVKFQFSHVMSKLTVVFTSGNAGTDVKKINSCTISGLVLDGTFNPVTGECAAKSGDDAETADLTLAPSETDGSVALPSLILFPQTVEAVTLKIKDSDNQDYICNLQFPDNTLESGNSYLFTITVKKTDLSVVFDITDWKVKDLEGEASSDD